MAETIKFQIQMKVKDLWQFSMYHSYRGMVGVFAVVFTGAALYYVIASWTLLSETQRIAMIFVVLMFPVLQPVMLYWKAWKRMRQPVMQTATLLEFQEEGLKVTQQDQEALFPWDQIGRIDRKPTMLVIYMDRIHAYLIPKEVYEERLEELSDFLHGQLPKEKLTRI